MNIGILTAMQKEHDQVKRLLHDCKVVGSRFSFTTGVLGKSNVVLMQCGIGKVNAAIGTTELIKGFHPDCVISTGVAGGATAQVHVMDVVVSDRLVQHDFRIGMGYARGEIQGFPRFFPADPKLVERAKSLNEASLHVGTIASGDQFISRQKDLDDILSDFPDTLAVDMESASIAQTCFIYGVPMVSFRIISDTPGADHHQQQYEGFWADLSDRSFQVTSRFLENLP